MVTLEELQSLHHDLWEWRDTMDANTAFTTPITANSHRFALTEIVEAIEALCLRNGEYARNHTKYFDVIEELSQYVLMTLTAMGRTLAREDEVNRAHKYFPRTWNDVMIDRIALFAAEANWSHNVSPMMGGIFAASTYPGINLPHDVRAAMNHLTLKHWKLPLDKAPLFVLE